MKHPHIGSLFLRLPILALYLLALCPSCSNDADTLQDDIKEIKEQTKDMVLSDFIFKAKDNNYLLQNDIPGKLINDSVIICHIPHVIENKRLIACFKYKGTQIFVDNIPVVSGETTLDYSSPVKFNIRNEAGEQKTYTVYTFAFTGLPMLFLTTEDYKDITKEEYTYAHLEIVDNIARQPDTYSLSSDVRIKVRGNSTSTLEKKPYKLVFPQETSVLGLPAEKKWVLLANYTDKTLLRNETAFFLGHISNLEYTCRSRFVEVFVNQQYMGNYQLGEQQEISPQRVNLSPKGILLEIDARATPDDDPFTLTTIPQPIVIKDPHVSPDTPAYQNMVAFLQQAEQALFGKDYLDRETGYAHFLDVPSFVDWYLINEIAKNNDACFFSSCYMHYEPGGKLKMGPIWDFDIAFGNVNYSHNESPKGFWIKNVKWFDRLFSDPNFVKMVKERFYYFYNSKETIYSHINHKARQLQYSIIENNNKWHLFYQPTWPNFAVWGSYENEIQYLKTWLEKRMDWLRTEFDKM